MVRDLDTCVSSAKTATGMKATALYSKKLARAFETTSAASRGNGDDLQEVSSSLTARSG
jgi:hypothetical protein